MPLNSNGRQQHRTELGERGHVKMQQLLCAERPQVFSCRKNELHVQHKLIGNHGSLGLSVTQIELYGNVGGVSSWSTSFLQHCIRAKHC